MQELGGFWLAGLLAVIVVCLCQAIRDFRARRFVWSLAAALSAILLSAMPIGSQTIVVDLPAP